MKTEHLREFAVLARCLNFTAAAKELFIAQSTLSTHMARLEDELGFALFERSGEVRLTVEGTLFSQESQAALDVLDTVVSRCRRLSQTARPLRVALQSPSALFARFARETLDFPFVFVGHDYQDPFFSVFTNDEADVMVNYDYRSFLSLQHEARRLNLTERSLASAPVSITVSSAHSLAAQETIKREDLRGATIVVNSLPDYERWKEIVLDMLGSDLNLQFELDPVGDLNNLACYDYGDRLHVCGSELNEQYLGRRSDIAVITHIDDVDLHVAQLACWRKTAAPDIVNRIELFCACWDEFHGIQACEEHA